MAAVQFRPAAMRLAVAIAACCVAGALGGAEQCHFALPPDLPYYWEPNCAMGMLGCWADSTHAECRFCGEAPYTGIPCPEDAVTPSIGACRFANAPTTPFYWEPQCEMGMLGCFADNVHLGCRFCGVGPYSSIPCPKGRCTFANPPRTPHYWDENCTMGMFGCNADGIHPQCRYCVKRPFDPVRCPASLAVPQGRCTFPGPAPTTPYYWEPACEFGMLGCWADGLHAECRWCGQGAYQGITCKVV